MLPVKMDVFHEIFLVSWLAANAFASLLPTAVHSNTFFWVFYLCFETFLGSLQPLLAAEVNKHS
jgi:hypothetical protein